MSHALDDETLTCVLQRVSCIGLAACVSRQFRRAAEDNLVTLMATPRLAGNLLVLLEKWSSQLVSLNLSRLPRDVVDDALLERVARWCSRLEVVDLTGCQLPTQEGYRCLAAGCPALRSINLTKCPIDDKALSTLARGCRNLEHIVLFGCGNVTDSGLGKVVHCCPSLRKVELFGCSSITDEGIAMLAKCRKLDFLNVRACRLISDASIDALVHGCPSLHTMNLTGCKRLSNKGLAGLSQCPNMHSLTLSGCSQISDAGLAWVVSGCQQLQELNLQGCHGITSASLATISAACPSLRCLNLKGTAVADPGLEAVAVHCKGMVEINLQGLERITDSSLCALASCPDLREVFLCGCCLITDQGLEALAQGCLALRKLSLRGCHRLTDYGVAALAAWQLKEQHAVPSQLEILLLDECSTITDAAMVCVAHGCPALQEVSLRGCLGIKGMGLLPLVDMCPNITAVDAVRCEISSQAVSYLTSEHSPLLRLALKCCSIKRGHRRGTWTRTARNCRKWTCHAAMVVQDYCELNESPTLRAMNPLIAAGGGDAVAFVEPFML